MADAKWANLAKIKARIGRLPLALKPALQRQLTASTIDLVSAQQAAARAQGLEREAISIHVEDNPRREISLMIIADVADPKGKPIGSNIEAGHKAPDGSQVAAIPAFFPTYRAKKKQMQADLRKAGRAAVRKGWTGNG